VSIDYEKIISRAKSRASDARRVERFVKTDTFMAFMTECRRHPSGGNTYRRALTLIADSDLAGLKNLVYLITRDLSLCSTGKLRDLCKQTGVTYYSDMSKEQMAKALEGLVWIDHVE